MESEEIKKCEGSLVYLGYDWQCSNRGWCRGFVQSGEVHSLAVSKESPIKTKIVLTKIPAKYITSLEQAETPSSLEREVLKRFPEKPRTIKGFPIEYAKPLNKE